MIEELFKKNPRSKQVLEFVAIERLEQIEKHGWTPEHDLTHSSGELKSAAMFALTLNPCYKQDGFKEFEAAIVNKKDRTFQRLKIAIALLLAESERFMLEKENEFIASMDKY